MSGLKHEFQCKLAAAPERVFVALTDPQELESWFAERVEVEPKVGGAFRFWGRFSYGVPTRAQATQRVVRFERPRTLTFTWTIHEQPSEVSFAIEADPEGPGGTLVKGIHEFAAAPKIGRAKELVDDLWRLQMGNLQAHVTGHGGVLLPDFADPAPEVKLSILIDAPRERVFRALLEPESLNKWFASAASVEPRAGGRYSLGWRYEQNGVQVEAGPTRILELVENEKLVIDWPDWRGDQSVPKQTLTWLLETVGKQTRVTLIHGGFVRTADISDYPHGWQFFLDRLKVVAEGGDPGPTPVGC